MAVKTIQQLKEDITTQSQKVANDSVTPTDVFGIDRDVLDSLFNILLTEYQLTLQGDTDGNITVDQNEKKVKLAQTLRNMIQILGQAGNESSLKIFCNADWQRDPEIYLSKALVKLRALDIRLTVNAIDRLILSATQTKLLGQNGSPVIEATNDSINIYDAQSGMLLVSRDNNGKLQIFSKKNGNIRPFLSQSENSLDLYNANTSQLPFLSVTNTDFSLFDYNGVALIKSTQSANGNIFSILRGSANPVINFNPATDVFTLYGNGNTTPVKIIEQTSDTSMVYYSIGGVALLTITMSGGNLGYAPNHEFARAMYKEISFTGTQSQWDALTTAQQSNYEHVSIID